MSSRAQIILNLITKDNMFNNDTKRGKGTVENLNYENNYIIFKTMPAIEEPERNEGMNYSVLLFVVILLLVFNK